MQRSYASNTSVSPDRSRGEIERLLARFGAGQFGYLTDNDSRSAHIIFTFRGLRVRISVGLPKREEMSRTPRAVSRRTTRSRRTWNARSADAGARSPYS